MISGGTDIRCSPRSLQSEPGITDYSQTYSMSFTIANPAPLGLFGFATACTINAIAKISNSQDTSAHFLTGIAFFGGGGAQILASTLQFLRNETHSALVFALFGFHWWNTALWYLFVSQKPDMAQIVPPHMRATYPAVLAVLTFILWLPTLRTSYLSTSTLGLVVLAFLLDVPAQLGSKTCRVVSCICALCASAFAIYGAAMQVVNSSWNREVLPRFAVPTKPQTYVKDGKAVELLLRMFEWYGSAPRRSFHLLPESLKRNQETVNGSRITETSCDFP